MSPRTRRILRLATFAAVAVGALFWLGAMVASLAVPPGRRDGFQMLGVILASVYAVVLVLPALILALLDRWPVVSLMFGATAVAVATDAVFPWLPWWLLAD